MLCTDVTDGDNGKIFVTEDLCSEILKEGTIFSQFERDMLDSFEMNRTRAITFYVNFVEPERESVDQHWPDFNHSNYDLFKPPSDDKLNKVFHRCFELIQPYLERDLYSRTPGNSVSWDGTFSTAKKTMNDPDSEEEINCLVIVWGMYGHVMT